MAVTISLKVLAVYLLSIPVGFFFVGFCLWFMRRTIGITDKAFQWLDFWVGTAERTVAMTLVWLKPEHLPVFIGGWIALKFAASWKRRPNTEVVYQSSLLSLVGNVFSFAFAIFAGWLLRAG